VALGARPREILRLVLGGAMRLSAAGLLVGIGGATLVTRLLGSALYDVHPLDPTTFAAVVATLVAVALFASLVPARRATRVDPVQTLRSE
jgi:ABC-type antimicrobial peptide transport system permease subunit